MIRRINRETLLYLFLAILLIIGGMLLARQLSSIRPPYHPQSKAADGTLVLWRWLERMGYQVRRLPETPAKAPPQADMIILFPGNDPFSARDAEMLYDWAAAGHTLVLAGFRLEIAISRQFGVASSVSTEDMLKPYLFQDIPLLPQAPSALKSPVLQNSGLDISDAPGALPVLNHHAGNKITYPAVAVQAVGQGVIWHLAPQAAPTNEALQGEMGSLIPALLRTAPEGGVIYMDIYRPFVAAEKAPAPARGPGLLMTILTTAWGRALVLAGALLLLFLLLQGRRLGPPLPAQQTIRRREASEYVVAMARLKRRARQRHAVARHQSQRLRSGLAAIWHIDAGLPLDELMAALKQSDAPPSPRQLQQIRETLSGLAAPASEADLVRLSAEVDKILLRK